MKERIQKVLSAAGVESRRHIEEMVLQGRVSVNGRTVTRLPVLIDPGVDRVSIDGELVKLRPGRRAGESPSGERLVYVLVNKPKNVYSTNVAQGEQRRLIDLLPPNFPRVYPVGRLDHDSRGLILLTNDGELTHELTHPRFGVSKTYRAVVDGFVSGETLERLKHGVWLADPKTQTGFKTGRSHIRVIERDHRQTILEIGIREGRNRQVRRMMANVGHKVRDLTRVKFGPLTLEGVGPGKWRLLSQGEVKKLRAAVEREQSHEGVEPATPRAAGAHKRYSSKS
jgi:23S rRNA pseudouridine2605 synthase